jgi:hypothetical protein
VDYLNQSGRASMSLGRTISSTSLQPANHRLARIQNRRSAPSNRGRGCRCWRTTSRKHRFSATSSAFGLKSARSPTHPSYHQSLPLIMTAGGVFHPIRLKRSYPDRVFAPYRMRKVCSL